MTTNKVFSFRTDEEHIDMLEELKKEEEKKVGYKITYSQLISKMINQKAKEFGISTEGKSNDSSK